MNPISPIIRLICKLISGLLYLLTLAAAFAGKINPHLWSLPSVLVLALPYLAIATMLATLCWLIARRFIIGGAGVLTLILSWGAVSTVLPIKAPKSSAEGLPEFTLLSYNILGGYDLEHPDASQCRGLQFVVSTKADIVCLQELGSLNPRSVPSLSKELRDSLVELYPYRIIDPANSLTLLSRYPARLLRSKPNDMGAGMLNEYEIKIGDRRLLVMNVHLSSFGLSETEREVFSQIHGPRSAKASVSELKGSLLTKLKGSFVRRAQDAEAIRNILNDRNEDTPIIVCGDFNDVPSSWAYRIVKGSDLSDAYADTGFGPMITYNRHGFYFRIDQILYGGDLRALNVERGSQKNSDHYPLLATFQFTPANSYHTDK